jgi:Xaa-Pro aminopeptidase
VGTLGRLGLPRMGFEAAHLTVSRLRWLEATLRGGPAVELVPTEGVVESVRITKDAGEQATLREAARRLSAVLQGVMADVRAGLTEVDVALELETGMRRTGFSRPAFDTIVASGPNSALPHARAGDRRLATGDLVVLDFGGVYGGYCVDLTRTVAVGEPDSEMARVYQAVLDAQRAAIAAVKPGVRAGDIDAAARGTLGQHGLAEAFGHSTGHGLGIEIHETPRIGPRREGNADSPAPQDDAIEPGMVFTIEPGAYIPGWGGVRIEDDVLVTSDGVEVLTNVPTSLTQTHGI